jgi:DNA-binding LytR/AlgR family response regulator
MGRTLHRFNLEDIDYIEAFSIYSKIYSKGTLFVVNEIISALEIKLSKKAFVRVHKSYIINTNKITNIDNKNIWINQTPIPLGRTYKPLFEGLLKLFDKYQ